MNRLWQLTENSPLFKYKAAIESNLSAKIVIVSNESYIQMFLFLQAGA